MWIRDGYGGKAWLDEESVEHLQMNGHRIEAWEEVPDIAPKWHLGPTTSMSVDEVVEIGEKASLVEVPDIAQEIKREVEVLRAHETRRKGWPKGRPRGRRV